MKAITILEPWASLIACGAKRIETRSWSTKYRGPIAIHTGKDRDKKGDRIRHVIFKAEQFGIKVPELQFGSVIAIAELVDCIYMSPEWIDTVSDQEKYFGWLEEGRYAWILTNVHPIDPVPARGKQRIWEWEG